jgi:hypothetical protein
MGYPTSFMSASAAIADTLLQLSSAVSREAYLANKGATPSLSVPRFTLHEIRFTRIVLQVVLRQIVMNNVR